MPAGSTRFAARLRPGVLVGAQLREEEGHAEVDGRAEPYLDGWCVGRDAGSI